MQDLSNNINPAVSIISAVRTAAANGTGVDLQGYEKATVLVDVGAEGDTLSSSVYFEVSLEESDDNSTFTDVAQAGIVDGTIAAGGIFLKLDGTAGGNPDTAGGVFRVEYVGNSRYIRVVLAKTGTHSNGTPIGAMVVRSGARHSGDNAFTAHNA
jgi:hypothetical protein|tara:strand:- start:57 stop:521 length:465 start_codon:yes stop_codon:yes gene_type:complete